jgi:hypothetical protein
VSEFWYGHNGGFWRTKANGLWIDATGALMSAN